MKTFKRTLGVLIVTNTIPFIGVLFYYLNGYKVLDGFFDFWLAQLFTLGVILVLLLVYRFVEYLFTSD